MSDQKKEFDLDPKQYEAFDLLTSKSLYVLLYGGARSGKTFAIVFFILVRAIKYPESRHLICRLHLADLKGAIINDTLFPLTKMWNELFYKVIRKSLNKQDWVLPLANGSQIWFTGLGNETQVEKALGREYATIYLNEGSQITYETFDKLRTRLAQNIQGLRRKILVDCNPPRKTHWIYKLFILHIDPIDGEPKKKHQYIWLQMLPKDNLHLPEGYIEDILEELSINGKKRFLYGEFGDEVYGALWTRQMIDDNRAKYTPKDFDKIVVGIDPAGSHKKNSNETGIVVVGKIPHLDSVSGKTHDHGYVIDDLSGKYSPDEWARKAIWAYDHYHARTLVVEINYGGDMVKANIRNLRKDIPIREVRAANGKIARAEPISALYEQGLIHHCGHFRDLESQLMSWTGEHNDSPDRLDALVWACYDLFINKLKIYIIRSTTGSGFSV